MGGLECGFRDRRRVLPENLHATSIVALRIGVSRQNLSVLEPKRRATLSLETLNDPGVPAFPVALAQQPLVEFSCRQAG
jgi:hypothetical protein